MHVTSHPRALAALALATGLSLGAGCAGREAAWEASEAAKDTAAAATPAATAEAPAADPRIAAADAAWEARLDEAKLREAIAAWEGLTHDRPNDAVLTARLARGYYFLADGHLSLQDGKGDEVLETFTKGVDTAERALMLASPAFAEQMRAGAKIEDAITQVDAGGLDAMYWYASNLGKFANAKGFTTRLFYKDRIVAIMKHALALDPKFFHGGPHRYFGAFYAIAPSFAGGDLAKSKEHFEKSLELSPDYLGTRVLYAQYYAPKMQDPELFKQQLQLVLDADAGKLPDVAPENTVEKKKAERLLAQQGELF